MSDSHSDMGGTVPPVDHNDGHSSTNVQVARCTTTEHDDEKCTDDPKNDGQESNVSCPQPNTESLLERLFSREDRTVSDSGIYSVVDSHPDAGGNSFSVDFHPDLGENTVMATSHTDIGGNVGLLLSDIDQQLPRPINTITECEDEQITGDSKNTGQASSALNFHTNPEFHRERSYSHEDMVVSTFSKVSVNSHPDAGGNNVLTNSHPDMGGNNVLTDSHPGAGGHSALPISHPYMGVTVLQAGVDDEQPLSSVNGMSLSTGEMDSAEDDHQRIGISNFHREELLGHEDFVADKEEVIKDEPMLETTTGSEFTMDKMKAYELEDNSSLRSSDEQESDEESDSEDSLKHRTSSTDEITICQLRSGSMLRVPVTVQGMVIEAVIDTAAEVTLISDRLYERLPRKPATVKEVIMHTAGREMNMKGFIIGPVQIQLGNRQFEDQVYVAPIEDNMLLGLDFMQKHGVNINIPDGQLQIGRETIDMKYSHQDGPVKVARVTVSHREVIPPNSAVTLKCEISRILPDYIVEPVSGLSVVIPRTLHLGGRSPKVCIINWSERNVIMKRNQHIATATEVEQLETTPPSSNTDINSQGEGVRVMEAVVNKEIGLGSVDERQLPDHLRELFSRSSENLGPEERGRDFTIVSQNRNERKVVERRSTGYVRSVVTRVSA
ncbi:MAG: retropepsin-like aspartic protease, partial [Sedimenticola sp.]